MGSELNEPSWNFPFLEKERQPKASSTKKKIRNQTWISKLISWLGQT